MLKKVLLLFALSLFYPLAQAAVDTPDENAMLHEWTKKAQFRLVPNEFELISWNVQKGEKREVWANDLQRLTKDSHFILLQEAMWDSFMPKVIDALASLDTLFALSFYYNNKSEATGVLVSSQIQTQKSLALRSPDREPFIQSPKMSLAAEYLTEDGSSLLVVNTHSINFVGSEKFRHQLQAIYDVIRNHQGPIIWAGDFNTWNNARTDILDFYMSKLGLSEIQPEGPEKASLDHIYFRGCDSAKLWYRTDIGSSDHAPLQARFSSCH